MFSDHSIKIFKQNEEKRQKYMRAEVAVQREAALYRAKEDSQLGKIHEEEEGMNEKKTDERRGVTHSQSSALCDAKNSPVTSTQCRLKSHLACDSQPNVRALVLRGNSRESQFGSLQRCRKI